MDARKKICLVVASEMTVKVFLQDQLSALSAKFAVSLLLNTTRPREVLREALRVKVVPVRIERQIAPWRDLLALVELWRIFRRHRFELIHSVTPKAGLLAMGAARLAGIPVRVHTFTGQVWVGRRGMMRLLLKTMDRIIAACATHVLVDSFSQRRFLVAEKVVPEGKSAVLAHGSISGVDRGRFRPDESARRDIRREYGIGEAERLLLYLGRLTRDKGLLDLARAFSEVAARDSGVHLLLVGPDEEGISDEIGGLCMAGRERLHFQGFTSTPERYMAAADIFCLPSYREGFGSVIVEAAACGVPAVASRIYGITDAVADGETGLLHEKGDVPGLRDSLLRLLDDPELRRVMGAKAAKRAAEKFDQAVVTAALLDFYRRATGG